MNYEGWSDIADDLNVGVDSIYKLARLLDSGESGSRVPEKAVKYYRMAAEAGHPEAKAALARLLVDKPPQPPPENRLEPDPVPASSRDPDSGNAESRSPVNLWNGSGAVWQGSR